jgi:mRNA-degrading endonuclease toxin of MazEF toxin-antitoxin module
VALPRGIAGNWQDCEVIIDQSRAIDNRRLARPLKPLPPVILRDVETKVRLAGGL